MRKFRELFLLSVSLCLFAFSCTLETAEDGTGSVSITLPGNQVNSRAVSPDETPTKYYIALFYGENATVEQKEGKVRDTHANSGETISFTKLTPGKYTLYVRGDAPFCYYEVSKNIIVNVGPNTEGIELGAKQNKTRVYLDLSLLTNISAFDLIITDINNNIVFTDKNILYTSEFRIPTGLMPGKYNIGFKTANSTNERYYIEGGNTFEIPRSGQGYETPQEVRKVITSRPIRNFILDPNAPSEGNGSERAPFKTLKYAIDKTIASSDVVHEDINIIVRGDIDEKDNLLINNNANISLIGDSTAGPTTIHGTFIVDNASLTIRSINVEPYLNDVAGNALPAIILNSGTLNLEQSYMIKGVVHFNGRSLINILAKPTPDYYVTVVVDECIEGKEIASSSLVDPGYHIIRVSDQRYEVDDKGKLKKISEYVNVKLDFSPFNKNISIRVSEKISPTEISLVGNDTVPSTDYKLPFFFDIGKTYLFELFENIPGDAGLKEEKICSKTLTIQKNVKNEVVMGYEKEIYNFFVDTITGNDEINTGTSVYSPFESIQRAVSEIQNKSIFYNASQYVIDLTGDEVGKDSIEINDIENLKLTSTDESIIDKPINVHNSNLTVENLDIDTISLYNSTLELSTSQGVNGISTIKINDNTSLIKPLNTLSRMDVMIDLLPSLYVIGSPVINLSSVPEQDKINTLECFYLKDPSFTLDSNGCIVKNNNISVTLDLEPQAERYAVLVTEDGKTRGEYPITAKSSNINCIVKQGSSCKVEVIDLFNHNEVVGFRTFTATDAMNSVNINLNRTIYVTHNGIDTNTGLSKDSGLKTFNAALTKLVNYANKDLDNQYTMILSPLITVGSYDETKATAMEIGDIEVNEAINLTVIGEKGLSQMPGEELLVPLNNGFVKVNNKDAHVTLDNIAITEKQPSSTVPNEGVINVTSGKVTLGTSVEILGVSVEKPSTTNLAYLGPNSQLSFSDASNGNLTSLYLEKEAKIILPTGFGDSNVDSTFYNITLSPSYDTTQSVILGDSLLESDTTWFNVNLDRYIDSTGKVKEMKTFTYNIVQSSIPTGSGSTDDEYLATNRNYYLQVESGGKVTESSTKISSVSNNTSSFKVKPYGTYDIRVVDKSEPTTPVVITNLKNQQIPSSGSVEIPLFDITLDAKDDIGNPIKNNIHNTLKAVSNVKDSTRSTHLYIRLLSGADYEESDWVIGSTDINLNPQINVSIITDKKSADAPNASITASQIGSLIKETQNSGGTISFEDITFIAWTTNHPFFNLTNNGFNFKNIIFENHYKETTEFIKKTKNAKVAFSSGITINNNSYITLIRSPQGYSMITLNEAINAPEKSIILNPVLDPDLTTPNYTEMPKILDGTNVSSQYTKFTLKTPVQNGNTYEINSSGQVVQQQQVP